MFQQVQMSNNIGLVRIIDLYESRVDDKRRQKLASFGVIGSLPPNLPRAEDLLKQYEDDPSSLEGQTRICTAPVGLQYGCPEYNRTEQICLNRCEKNLDEKQGFSYQAANVGSGWVRPGVNKIVNTQSGHRVTKRYAVSLSEEARTVLNLSFHKTTDSLDQMIQKESDDHHTDCADRKTQSGSDKFKSAYYSRRDWAVNLYRYCLPFKISIAGTNPDGKFSLESHSYLSTAIKLAGEQSVTKYLTAFTDHNCEKVIQASCVVAGSLFLNYFAPQIAKIDTDNNVDSFNLMVKWWWKEYGPIYKQIDPDKRNLNQRDIIDGGTYKGNEFAIARFVFLYNDYVRLQITKNGWKLDGRNKTAIPFNGSDENGWIKFLTEANHLVKPLLGNTATTPFF